MNTKVNLDEKLALFAEHWSPKLIAELNDYEIKLVKIRGEFVWHRHEHTDELFLVLDGELTIDLRHTDGAGNTDGAGSVVLGPRELYVVPRGVEHRPRAAGEVTALLVEPRGVVNTGTAGGDLTAVIERI